MCHLNPPAEPSTAIATPDSGRPLVTFVLVTCNQEAFVQEAAQGALSQTYSPLEIILSDDASSDRTYELLREVAAPYRGPHRVVLNRNPTNLGIGEHINRVTSLAQGELIVAAAGDDISAPQRTAVVVETWLSGGKRATSIHSDFVRISAQGGPFLDRKVHSQFVSPAVVGADELCDFVRGRNPLKQVNGCAHAWSRRLFDLFGPLRRDVVFEDRALAFRSLLVGSVAYVREVLIQYRMHANNVSGRQVSGSSQAARLRSSLAERREFLTRWLHLYESFREDLLRAVSQGLVEPGAGECVREVIERCSRSRRVELGAYADSLLAGLWGSLRHVQEERSLSCARATLCLAARRLQVGCGLVR